MIGAIDWTLYALRMPAVVFAGVSKGGFGSGAAFASASILALVVEPVDGAGPDAAAFDADRCGQPQALLETVELAGCAGCFWARCRGSMLGALLYRMADPDDFPLLIGAISTGLRWRGRP